MDAKTYVVLAIILIILFTWASWQKRKGLSDLSHASSREKVEAVVTYAAHTDKESMIVVSYTHQERAYEIPVTLKALEDGTIAVAKVGKKLKIYVNPFDPSDIAGHPGVVTNRSQAVVETIWVLASLIGILALVVTIFF